MPSILDKNNSYIRIPARVVLTREGIDLFSSLPSNPVTRVKNREGAEREGLISGDFNASTLQKLIMRSSVEELHIELPDLLTRRFEILSLNNLIVYAILYRKLSPTLAGMMFESSVVKEYNRKNPKNSIVSLRQVDRKLMSVLREKKAGELAGLVDSVKNQVLDLIHLDNSLLKEDREVRILALEKFITMMDERIWYLFYIIHNTPLGEQMIWSFSRILKQYLDNTQVGIHLGNLIMEFIQNAEKVHFSRIIQLHNMAPASEVDTFLRDGKNRAKVIEAAKKTGQLLYLTWNISPATSNLAGRKYRVVIHITNYGLINEGVRAKLSQKMRSNVEGIPLSDFYNTNGSSSEKLGAGLGLLYNSYLEDFCRDRDILYSCNILPEPAKEKTTVRIEINF